MLWVEQNGFARSIKVRAGISDGIMTEVQADDLKENVEVIVGEQKQGAGNTGTVNPFTPQLPSRGGRPPGRG